MSLNKQNREQLESLIQEHELGHALPYLLDTTKQGIRCAKVGPDRYDTSCTSRIGGDPDLPPGAEWPLTASGVPMTFLVQLNLLDVSLHDESSLLPTGGMLYFFVGIDEPAYNIEHRVLFVPADQLDSAVRRVSPEVTALEGSFSAYRLEPRASLEPPNYAYVDYDQVETESVDYEQYEDFLLSLQDSSYEDVALLFGYPTGQHDDSEYEAALMMLTGKNYEYSLDKALAQLAAHFAGNEEKARQEVQDTLMLLEIDSDEDVGFCWWDAGVLQFFIRKEDLQAGRFDNTYCSLYSS